MAPTKEPTPDDSISKSPTVEPTMGRIVWWITLWTAEKRTCIAPTIRTDNTATTEALCKAACQAEATCGAIYLITDSRTSPRCILYAHCDRLRNSNWEGNGYVIVNGPTMA